MSMCHRNFMDKLMKWKLIENELRQAHQLLPKNIKQSDFGYREEDFLEYLSHNELRLCSGQVFLATVL